MSNTKKSGSFDGKSNKLGFGGRAAQLKAQGVSGAVIGAIARSKGAAPGQKNYHGGKLSRLKTFNKILKQSSSPVFLGWYIRWIPEEDGRP